MGYYYYLYFISVKTEEQRYWLAFPRLNSDGGFGALDHCTMLEEVTHPWEKEFSLLESISLAITWNKCGLFQTWVWILALLLNVWPYTRYLTSFLLYKMGQYYPFPMFVRRTKWDNIWVTQKEWRHCISIMNQEGLSCTCSKQIPMYLLWADDGMTLGEWVDESWLLPCSLKRWLVHRPNAPLLPHPHYTEYGLQKPSVFLPRLALSVSLARSPLELFGCVRPSVGSQPWACQRPLSRISDLCATGPLPRIPRWAWALSDSGSWAHSPEFGSTLPFSTLLTYLYQNYSICFPVFFFLKIFFAVVNV